MNNFPLLARYVVLEYIKKRLDKIDPPVEFGIQDVYVIWFVKVLQNWKAMVSTSLPDLTYYELTYNGDSDEIYIDEYKKFNNTALQNVRDIAVIAAEPEIAA